MRIRDTRVRTKSIRNKYRKWRKWYMDILIRREKVIDD